MTLSREDKQDIAQIVAAILNGNAAPVAQPASAASPQAPRRLRDMSRQAVARRQSFQANRQDAREQANAGNVNVDGEVNRFDFEKANLTGLHSASETLTLGRRGGSNLKRLGNSMRVYPGSKAGLTLYFTPVLMDADSGEQYTLDSDDALHVTIASFMQALSGKIEHYQYFPWAANDWVLRTFTKKVDGQVVTNPATGRPETVRESSGNGNTFVVYDFTIEGFNDDGEPVKRSYGDVRFFVSPAIADAVIQPARPQSGGLYRTLMHLLKENSDLGARPEHGIADLNWLQAHMQIARTGIRSDSIVRAMRGIGKVSPVGRSQSSGRTYGKTNDECKQLYLSLAAFRQHRLDNRVQREADRAAYLAERDGVQARVAAPVAAPVVVREPVEAAPAKRGRGRPRAAAVVEAPAADSSDDELFGEF